MKWTGKLIGGFIGLLLAGPFGMVAGIVVGHYFDLGRLTRLTPHERADIEAAFFTAAFSVMGHIAKADGRVSEEEIQVARSVMAQLGLNTEQRKEAIGLFRMGKKPQFNLDKSLSELLKFCKPYSDLRRVFVEIQFQAAYADGRLSREERRILKVICHRLGFTTVDFVTFDNQFRAQQQGYRHHHQERAQQQTYEPKPHETLANAYKILGVSPNVGDDELKKAYRRLLSQHHPDKLVSKGLPESLIKLANQKTHEIKAAYDQIKKARGLS